MRDTFVNFLRSKRRSTLCRKFHLASMPPRRAFRTARARITARRDASRRLQRLQQHIHECEISVKGKGIIDAFRKGRGKENSTRGGKFDDRLRQELYESR